MPKTWIDSEQIKDGEVKRQDLNTTQEGSAVIRKIRVGSGLTMSYDGVDEGTGDVTVGLVPTGTDKYTGETIIDFGPISNQDYAVSTTVDATWITYSDQVLFSLGITSDHDPGDASIEGVVFYIGNIQPYQSFDIYANCPLGTWGQFKIFWRQA